MDLPLSELMPSGRLEVYPYVEQRGLLFITFKSTRATLSAGPYIGLIPLTPTISVEVRPKMPVSNLARVIDAARGSLSSIAGVGRLYVANELASESVLAFLAANLADAMKPIEIGGLLKEYRRRSEVTSAPSGRIDLTRTLQECWSRGREHQLAVQRFEQTSDVAVNRVLKTALRRVLDRLRTPSAESRALKRRLGTALHDLPDSIGYAGRSDINRCRAVVIGRTLGPSRSYYYRALEVALLIIDNKGVSLEVLGGDVSLDTFIVDFESIFEAYLRRVLQRSAETGVVVRDGNEEGKKRLFDDTKVHVAQPDIVVVRTANGRKVIAEVKYKEKPNRDDINQAIVYAQSYKCSHAILVHQNKQGAPTGPKHIGKIQGITLQSYAFDLGAEVLDDEEAAFCRHVFDLVPTE